MLNSEVEPNAATIHTYMWRQKAILTKFLKNGAPPGVEPVTAAKANGVNLEKGTISNGQLGYPESL